MPTPSADPHETARRLGLVATAAQWQAFGEHLRTIPAFKGDDLVEVLDVDGGGIRFRYSIVDTVPAPSAFATGGPVRPETPQTPAPEMGTKLVSSDPLCLTLGALQQALRFCSEDEPVRFSPLHPESEIHGINFATPEALDSWRGDYAQLALDYSHLARATTAGQLLEWVDERMAGKPYTGYKGGTYTASSGTYVNVAHWGDSGTLELRGLSRGRDYRLEGNPMTTWLHVVDTEADDDDESEG